jgi:hypothetical protein
MKKALVLSIILVIVLLASGVGFLITFNRLNSFQSDLQTARNTIELQNNIIDENKSTLIDLQSQIESKDNYADNLTESLRISKNLLDNATSELENASSKLDVLEIQVSNYKDGLSNARLQLDYANNKIKLMEDTFGDVNSGILPLGSITSGTVQNLHRSFKLKRNPEVVDPTWNQLETFLKTDKTDQKLYVEGLYTCGNFAEDIFNAAEAKGIRAAIVCIYFEDDPLGHALNAFKTTDRGLVYIDCTGDTYHTGHRMVKNANLKIGDVYECEFVFPNDDFYFPMGKVSRISIFW